MLWQPRYGQALKNSLLSGAKAAQGMQIYVNMSVCLSVFHTNLFVKFLVYFINQIESD